MEEDDGGDDRHALSLKLTRWLCYHDFSYYSLCWEPFWVASKSISMTTSLHMMPSKSLQRVTTSQTQTRLWQVSAESWCQFHIIVLEMSQTGIVIINIKISLQAQVLFCLHFNHHHVLFGSLGARLRFRRSSSRCDSPLLDSTSRRWGPSSWGESRVNI